MCHVTQDKDRPPSRHPPPRSISGEQKHPHLPFLYSPLPPRWCHPLVPSFPFHFRWLTLVCAELSAFGAFVERAKPIWDWISCLPALSTLKTTTILSWGRSSQLITVCSGHGQGQTQRADSGILSLFQSTHVVTSSFVSQTPGRHIWSCPGRSKR